MDKVFEKTRELAMAIMESDAYRTMHEAEQAAMRNPMAASLMSDYLEAKGAVETVLQENDPDPAQLKALSEKMESCQEKLNMLDEVIALSQARSSILPCWKNAHPTIFSRYIFKKNAQDARFAMFRPVNSSLTSLITPRHR